MSNVKKSNPDNASYYAIPKEETYNGMLLAYRNADALYDSAVTISRKGKMYIGAANSLLILSSEESIKGFILTSIYFDVKLPFEVHPIFRHHWAKHLQGKDLQTIITITSSALSAARLLTSKKLKGGELVKEVINTASLFWNKSDNEKWWDTANDIKNDGLYVNFVNGKFRSPSEINVAQFNESKAIVSAFLNSLSIVEKLKPDDYRRFKGEN